MAALALFLGLKEETNSVKTQKRGSTKVVKIKADEILNSWLENTTKHIYKTIFSQEKITYHLVGLFSFIFLQTLIFTSNYQTLALPYSFPDHWADNQK
ncbi:hypothetical protein DFQ04_1333 [Algoriphagus boseongensis]|uniref:Uncharacterized protein n=1 Tax=Algoriphagus boseongensis TaxID=1442587 RepID=A0A4R6T8X6_9BACT|nr:hypothetical protein DFQ04_1333 [Algoriphagus boseongensis]